MMMKFLIGSFLSLLLLAVHKTDALSGLDKEVMGRRQAILSTAAGALAINPWNAFADGLEDGKYEFRDRKSNKNALVREDYYYMMGRTPPRALQNALRLDDPQFNAFGACQTQADGSSANSCTYVSLKQRIPAYSKYAFSIGLGAKEFVQLKGVLQECQTNPGAWQKAATFVETLPASPPPPPVDALLKMALFGSSMLTSPNYSGPSKELLVARFYVNEASYATEEIAAAIETKDAKRALEAWEFGKDSWNSYFQIVNDKISPKVGDKFDLIV
ncbi:MAG: hypothetical protein SGBAC_003201 [Bacillariaceae sp.]